MAAAILNRMRGKGWAAHITSPAEEVTSMNGVTVQRQRPLEFAAEAVAAEHPDLPFAADEEGTRAGAGGLEKVRTRRLERIPARIGGLEVVVPVMEVDAAPADGGEGRYGVVGIDLLRLFASFVLDFRTMRLEVAVRR